MNPVGSLLVFLIRLYQKLVSPILTALFGPMGMGCRFTPTCSVYALEAFQIHGAGRGGGLALRRLCRCHPWGPSGHDPVPRREQPNMARRGGQDLQVFEGATISLGGDEAMPAPRHFPD